MLDYWIRISQDLGSIPATRKNYLAFRRLLSPRKAMTNKRAVCVLLTSLYFAVWSWR